MDHLYNIYVLDNWTESGGQYEKRLTHKDIPSWEEAMRMIARFEKARPDKIFVMEGGRV